MMAGRDGKSAVAGGPARHIPVLARQVFDALGAREGGVYIDGTFGAGGHASAILQVAGTRVIGIDRDRSAIAGGFALVEAAGGRLTLAEDRFANLEQVARDLGHASVDGILLDLGVSSMQLDQAERGFSFRNDGPLDMRMGGEGPSAADLVNAASERDLAQIIATLGEERFARNVARAIVKARAEQPIATTRTLAEVIERVVHARPGEIHPATRTFQALRMFVNDELGELATALAASERLLKTGGRLAVISFHSLEDRVVKTFLTERGRVVAGSRHQPELPHAPPSFKPLTRKPVVADDEELAANPRARSAKLRAAERTDAAPIGGDLEHLLPRLPSLADAMRARAPRGTR
jgi:16S rRNA (cytosine1402-N4)-methyltransferase